MVHGPLVLIHELCIKAEDSELCFGKKGNITIEKNYRAD